MAPSASPVGLRRLPAGRLADPGVCEQAWAGSGRVLGPDGDPLITELRQSLADIGEE